MAFVIDADAGYMIGWAIENRWRRVHRLTAG
jgi:hypothetical protein